MKTPSAVYAHRATLCGLCTLDGEPAEVRAPRQSEATVQTLDPDGPSIRTSWEMVAHVRQTQGGAFKVPHWMKEAA